MDKTHPIGLRSQQPALGIKYLELRSYAVRVPQARRTTGPDQSLAPQCCGSAIRADYNAFRQPRKCHETRRKMRKRIARMQDLGLDPAEFRVLQRLNHPAKIQDFVDAIPQNFEREGQTCLSVREVLKQKRAHCIEGAMVAACALWVHGETPMLLDLKADRDYDHVVALFRRGRCWGAISKTNPPMLRWRDPVYRSLRELAMTYLHEYANRRHQKTLRSYAGPLDLRCFDPSVWVTNTKNCWEVGYALEDLRHHPLVTPAQGRRLRLRDAIEREAGALKSYPRPE